MAHTRISVVVAGLGFGAEFVPIYLAHPDVADVAICDADARVLATVGDKFGVTRRFTTLDDVLASSAYDAVHLLTPIPLHAQQAMAILEAGKHCASTVPMAIDIAGLQGIVAAQRRTQRNYMMMETAVYTREFLFVKEMMERGELGPLSFLRGAHYQDMEGWPTYWQGLPPMYYATHAISPLLALARTRATTVHCLGSGLLRPALHIPYNNPFPVETAIFQLADVNLAAEVTRSLFQTAHAYTESFTVYAEKISFEWQQLEEEQPVLHIMEPLGDRRGRPIQVVRVAVPDRQDLLPPEIARFTQRTVYDESHPHRSFLQGGGHGGSHPHLVHEFVRSIVEQRPPAIDAVTAAQWTAAGICAHESALKGGEAVSVPRFD